MLLRLDLQENGQVLFMGSLSMCFDSEQEYNWL